MIPQPLDSIMTKFSLSNADLVKASTEQLTFKMVAKGRKGKRLTTNVQDKILTALLAVRPELNLRRRDLFRYEPADEVVSAIKHSLDSIRKKEIKYPQFIDLLGQAGVTGYMVDVAENLVTFYAPGGEAHIEKGPQISQAASGPFDEEKLRAAISAAQKETIDHPTFLKRIHEAGIGLYEVNIRKRTIKYKAEKESYKEKIPVFGVEPEPDLPAETMPVASNPAKPKKKRPGVVRTTRKGRLTIRNVWRIKKKARNKHRVK